MNTLFSSLVLIYHLLFISHLPLEHHDSTSVHLHNLIESNQYIEQNLALTQLEPLSAIKLFFSYALFLCALILNINTLYLNSFIPIIFHHYLMLVLKFQSTQFISFFFHLRTFNRKETEGRDDQGKKRSFDTRGDKGIIYWCRFNDYRHFICSPYSRT